MRYRLINFLIILSVAGCANPINRVTSDNYARSCNDAKNRGQLEVAEQACYRALVNVDWGNLGPELKSQRLYNLALIKRGLAKFQEAEDLLKQSIAIEEKLSPLSKLRIGRRQVELSVNLAAQGKWSDGSQLLEQMLPMTNQFEGPDRKWTSEVLHLFAEQLRKTNQIELAKRFDDKSSELAR
jgi:tetratricopeptide (TPR) repeat protein